MKDADIKLLNDMAGFLSFKPNFIGWALMHCDANVILVDTGNQAGKTSNIAKNYVARILGEHPIEKRNMRPNTIHRTIRFASENLPTESEEEGEIRNTVYPQFKKLFPPYLIKKDITARRPAITIRDYQGGKDIIVEFVSYNQEVQSQAGVQRFSIFLDEQAPKSFYEEQLPRLLAADGDMIIGITPAENITYLFEEIFQKAGTFYNSPSIVEYLATKGEKCRVFEKMAGDKNIAVIRAATDDNPTLNKEVIEEKYSKYDDLPTMEVRRYGLFHQISGIIFKEFDKLHVISRNQHFQEGIPHSWVHARGIDFHEHTNWACGWVALSPQNEAFVYDEYNPSPDRFVTSEIGREIAHRSRDYKFAVNLIDPWAAKKQINTGFTPIDDLNRAFSQFRRDGIGTGGYWQAWDTKNLRGRDSVKERLKNARIVGKPFNNRMIKNGVDFYVPTIWFTDNCNQTIYSFKNWRWEEWATRESYLTKDEKNKPQDKHSHFPVMIECIFKHPAFNTRFSERVVKQPQSAHASYMRGMR